MSERKVKIEQSDILSVLYKKLAEINPGMADLEPYEFRYCMHPWHPADGWESIEPAPEDEIERMIGSLAFFESIQFKPKQNGAIVLDGTIVRFNRMLFAGLATGEYSSRWVRQHFYFDIRGFYFLPRTVYFTPQVLEHLNGKPYRQFEQKQQQFDTVQSIGYKRFKEANAEVDRVFIETVKTSIRRKGTPLVMAIAGPTAAGKTEIVDRLYTALNEDGLRSASIEMDHFLTDRDEREAKGIHSLGRQAIHLSLFIQSLTDICAGRRICIPRYDFISGTSSHFLDGTLKPGGVPILIEPADIIFIEGNFPFLIPEVIHLIGIKVVYLTSDEIRLKRKWKRDIDYRKKYDPNYFLNRFFQEQFPMAQKCFIPQLEVCDMAVDTSGAALWTTAEISELLAET